MKKIIRNAKKILKAGDVNRAAVLFEQAGELERALSAFKKAGEFIRAGEISITLGRGHEAVDCYKKGHRFDLVADYYEARKNYPEAARYYVRAGTYDKAARMYDAILRKFPKLRDVPGEINKHSDEEIKISKLGASAHFRAENFEQAVKLYFKIGMYKEEAECFLKLKEYFSAGEAFKRAGLYADAGEAFSAGELFEDAARSYEMDRSYSLAGNNYAKVQLYEQAGLCYEKAGQLFAASDVYSEGELLDSAIKVLTSVRVNNPGYIEAVQRIIKLTHQKRYVTPPAKRYFMNFTDVKPINTDNLEIYCKIFTLLKQSEFTEEAEKLREKVIEISPEAFEQISKKEVDANEDKASSTDIKQILDEDYEAREREQLYIERENRFTRAKQKNEVTTATIAKSADETLASAQRPQTPQSFMHIREGQKLGDRYLILKLLGSGGMGTVYKANDLELDEQVAIKILSPQLNVDDNVVARFKQEIKLARQIVHPNIIRIHDLGDIYGLKFITMEYFPGKQVKEIIAENGFYTVPEGLNIMLKICSGLIAAHKKGIIHRDIKSQNIMISADGVIKVLDFGIAKSAEIAGLTTDGSILGTPEYISPEAIMQKPVDARSDIYSVGIVMFEIFTGCVPFTGDNIVSVIRQHLYDDPKKPSSINETLPEEIEDVIMHCIERDPENRYQSVAELRSEIQLLLSMFGSEDETVEETQHF